MCYLSDKALNLALFQQRAQTFFIVIQHKINTAHVDSP